MKDTFKDTFDKLNKEDRETGSDNSPIAKLGIFALIIFPVSIVSILVISILKSCGG